MDNMRHNRDREKELHPQRDEELNHRDPEPEKTEKTKDIEGILFIPNTPS